MVPIKQLLAGADAHRLKTGKPLVTLSYAQSLDGSIAIQRSRPLRLSGQESLVLTHRLRDAHDAILVGIGTLLADDPYLNVRLVAGTDPQPVILDSRLRTSTGSAVFSTGSQPLIATTEGANPQLAERLTAAGARLLYFPPDQDHRIPLSDLLYELGFLDINTLMVEGGAQVITSFLRQRLVDRVVITLAPLFAGGVRPVERLLLNDEARIESLPRLGDYGYERLGDDLIVWGKLAP